MGNFTFENQSGNTFLVYSADEEICFDTVSLGMMTNNTIEGLVPVVYSQLDSTKYLRYNITSKISLQQYFQGVIKKDQFVKIFYSIIKTILSVKEYMIPEESLILDTDRIYVDVSDNSASMVCLPILNKNSFVDILGFLKNIMFSITFDQNEDCRYVARIINYLNGSVNLSLEEFSKMLLEIAQDNSQNYSTLKQENTQQRPIQQTNVPQGNIQQTNVSQSNIQQGKMPQSNIMLQGGLQQRDVPQSNMQQRNAPQGNIHQSNMSQGNNMQNMAWQNNSKKDSEMKKGFLFSFGKKDKEKNQNKKKKEKKTEKNSSIMDGMKIPNSEVKYNNSFANPSVGTMPATQQTMQQQQTAAQQVLPQQQTTPQQTLVQQQTVPQQVLAQQQTAAQQQVIPQQVVPQQHTVSQQQIYQDIQPQKQVKVKAGETMDLSALNQGAGLKPVLVRVKTGERITITSNILRIGREPESVDYCVSDNMAVGRRHADIFSRDDEYYICDINTKNHTYVDGRMIQPGQECKLSNGMRIMLANEEFEFKYM